MSNYNVGEMFHSKNGVIQIDGEIIAQFQKVDAKIEIEHGEVNVAGDGGFAHPFIKARKGTGSLEMLRFTDKFRQKVLNNKSFEREKFTLLVSLQTINGQKVSTVQLTDVSFTEMGLFDVGVDGSECRETLPFIFREYEFVNVVL